MWTGSLSPFPARLYPEVTCSGVAGRSGEVTFALRSASAVAQSYSPASEVTSEVLRRSNYGCGHGGKCAGGGGAGGTGQGPRAAAVPLSARPLPSLCRSSRFPRPFPGQRRRRPAPHHFKTAGAVMSPASPWCSERGGVWSEVGVALGAWCCVGEAYDWWVEKQMGGACCRLKSVIEGS